MTRNRIALLAAALVVIVAAGILVGTRINSNQSHNTSAPASTPSPRIDQAMVNQLLAKPLNFQKLTPSDPCPDSSNPDNGYFGSGPAYGIPTGIAGTSAWGTYLSIVTPLGMRGPVVARPKDLTNGSPVLEIGPYGAGPVYATDVYQGKTVNQFQAVAFNTDAATKSNFTLSTGKYVMWSYLQAFKKGWGGGCVGVQIDSPSFSEIFYAYVPNN